MTPAKGILFGPTPVLCRASHPLCGPSAGLFETADFAAGTLIDLVNDLTECTSRL